MSTITDYASLKQAITDFEARSDLTTYADYFIQSAEDDIYDDIFILNEGRGVAELETTFSEAIANGVLALPSNYLGLRSVTVTAGGGTYPLQRKTVEFILSNYPVRAPMGVPAFIARSGTSFIFGPYPDSNYTVSGLYWQRKTALSAANTTTWMTDDMPMTLFAACMKAVKRFLKDPDGVGFWDADYKSRLGSFIAGKKAEEYSGSELSMTVA